MFDFNKIYIFESDFNDSILTAPTDKLYSDLSNCKCTKNIAIYRIKTLDVGALYLKLQEIKETLNCNDCIVIHWVFHGLMCSDGFTMDETLPETKTKLETFGLSNRVIISWEVMANLFKEINQKTNNMLMLSLCVCKGLGIEDHIDNCFSKYLLASNKDITTDEAQEFFPSFFCSLIEEGIEKAKQFLTDFKSEYPDSGIELREF